MIIGNSLESKSAITSSKLVIVNHSSIAHPPQVPAHDVTEQHNSTQHNTTQHTPLKQAQAGNKTKTNRANAGTRKGVVQSEKRNDTAMTTR
jgi:hypothetical protein